MTGAPLRVRLPEHPVGVHPLAASDAKAQLLVDLMWRPLSCGGGRALAQEVRLTDKTLQVTLSPAVRWQNGAPVSTEDAAYTLSMLAGRPGWRDVTLTAVSRSRFKLRLPFQSFSHRVRKLRLVHASDRPATEVGNGPYRLDYSHRGWTATCCGHSSPELARQIDFVIIPDAGYTLEAIERSEVHVAEIDEFCLAEARLRGWSDVPASQRPSAMVVSSTDPPAVEILGFNTACSALESRFVRQQLAAAIDRRGLMSSPPALCTPCGSIFGALGDNAHKVASQRAVLDGSGFEISIATGSESRGRLASLVAAQLARSGLTVGLRTLPWNELLDVLGSGRFSAFLMALGSAPEDPGIGHSSLVGERGVLFSRLPSRIVDTAIDEASTAPDARSRWQAAARIDVWIRKMRPCVPLLRHRGRIYGFAAGIRPHFGASGLALERCKVGGIT